MIVHAPADHIRCETTAVVLAGGLGRRMGHRDKGLLPLAGISLVEWVLRAVRPQVDSLLLNSDNPEYRRFGYPLLGDAVPDRPGPLAGMLAGLEAAETEFVLTVPCDAPQLPPELVARLCAALCDSDADVAVAGDGTRMHPVINLARRSVAPSLRAWLEAGERRVEDWVRSQRFVEVEFAPESFTNVNTPEGLRTLEQNVESTAPQVPVLGFAAFSGTGKTTLLEQLIPALGRRGIRVALIKHAHHQFDIDKPGKDSYRLRKAGARQVLIASRQRWALMTELEEDLPEPRLGDLLGQLDPDRFDLVLVEGFKHEAIPKIELHRPALGKPLLHPDDQRIIAFATDEPERAAAKELPVLDLNDIDAIADFVAEFVRGPAGKTKDSTDQEKDTP